MKKLLTLLFVSTLLFACSSSDNKSDNGGGDKDNTKIATPEMEIPSNPIAANAWTGDWNDTSNPNYRGRAYNPIEGDWLLKQINGKASDQFLLYEFRSSLGMYVVTKKPADGKMPDIDYNAYKRYTINNTQMKDSRGYIYNYTVAANRQSMTLYDGTNTYSFVPYDFNGIWYWKGDWNDLNSVYYDIYKGKYNPIEGIWKLVDKTVYYWFGEDYKLYISYKTNPIYQNYFFFGIQYKINNIGIKAEDGYINDYKYSKYWIYKDTLYLQEVNSQYELKDIRKYTKYRNDLN